MATQNIDNYQGGNEVSFQGLYSGVLNTLNRNQARIDAEQKAERARAIEAQKSLQSSVSKINANGLQQVDIPDYEKMYNGVKDAYNRVIESKYSPSATMEFEKKKAELASLVSASKERGQRDFTANQNVLTNIDKYKDGEVKKYMDTRNSTPTLRLNDINPDYSQFRIMYDSAKLDKDLETGIKTIMDSGEVKQLFDTQRIGLSGRDYALDTTSSKVVPQALALGVIEQLYKGNSNAKRTIDEVYGGDLNAFYEANKGKFSQVSTKRDTKVTPVVKVSVSGGETGESDYVIDNYVIAEDNKGRAVTMPKFMQFNQPQTISGVIEGTDPTTGKPVKLTGSTKTKVTGVGVYKNNKVITIEDEDEGVIVIPQDKYLNRAGMSKPKRKAVEEANVNFDSYINLNKGYSTSRTSQSKTVSSKPTTTTNGVKGLPKGGF